MHPMQDYFWEDFYMHRKFDMQPMCTSMLAKFNSSNKWVLQTNPLERILTLELQEVLANNLG
jgi:hypothetical protein